MTMELTNQFGLPDVVVQSLTRDSYDRGKSNRSVTQLIDSPRIGILNKEYDAEIEQDVIDFLWSRFGTGMHQMFEGSVEGAEYISEERLTFKHMGWSISGQIDLQEITSDGHHLWDYKVTSAWSVVYGKPEWHDQMNAYAWIVRHVKKVPVTALKIIAILRDWNRRKAGEDGDYPESPIQVIDIPLLKNAEQDSYMDGRIKLHQDAEFERLRGGPLPLCSDQERWQKPTKWAIKKAKAKRAVRVFDTEAEAEKFMETKDSNYRIEVRTGEDTRCVQNWCRVSAFCDQFMGNKNEME